MVFILPRFAAIEKMPEHKKPPENLLTVLRGKFYVLVFLTPVHSSYSISVSVNIYQANLFSKSIFSYSLFMRFLC